MDAPNTSTPSPLTLAAAARRAGVSQVTLRKWVQRGELEAEQVQGQYGPAWAIAPDALAAFVLAHYGRELSAPPVAPQPPAGATPQDGANLAALREKFDATLVELGRYRALASGAEDANARVEDLLKARIAELTAERDAAQAIAARGFWRRLFGG